MKNIKLVMVVFIAIAVVSLILLLDLFAIKGLLPFSQAIENSLFSGQLGLLFLITGAVIWKHADATASMNEGMWLILEPIIALAILFIGIIITVSSIFIIFARELTKVVSAYYIPTIMTSAIIFIVIVFICYYLHIKK